MEVKDIKKYNLHDLICKCGEPLEWVIEDGNLQITPCFYCSNVTIQGESLVGDVTIYANRVNVEGNLTISGNLTVDDLSKKNKGGQQCSSTTLVMTS